MAKFMLIKISLIAEITDADALREAALKIFDAADMTSDDHPGTAECPACLAHLMRDTSAPLDGRHTLGLNVSADEAG